MHLFTKDTVIIMTTLFVSRHPGAIEWVKHQEVRVDRWLTHLNIEDVNAGDVVIGTLPMHMAAAVCAKGARFVSLEISLSEAGRGRELSQADMEGFRCTLCEYAVVRLKTPALLPCGV